MNPPRQPGSVTLLVEFLSGVEELDRDNDSKSGKQLIDLAEDHRALG